MERVFLTAFLRETIQRALYSYSIIGLFHCSTQGTRSPLGTYYAYMRKRKLMEGEMNNAKEGGRKEQVIFAGIMGAALSGTLLGPLLCVSGKMQWVVLGDIEYILVEGGDIMCPYLLSATVSSLR